MERDLHSEAKKIYIRNPDTGVIRWRYVLEKANDIGWPLYGRLLTGRLLTGRPLNPEEAAQADG